MILFNFFTNSKLLLCPGLKQVIFALMLDPIKKESPMKSSNLCLAGSLSNLRFFY